MNPSSEHPHQFDHQPTLWDQKRGSGISLKDEEHVLTLKTTKTASPTADKKIVERHSKILEDPQKYSQNSVMNGFQSESCLMEQLRVSESWRHLMAVEQSGQVKLNLKEQLSVRL